jgi:hypothetical protein
VRSREKIDVHVKRESFGGREPKLWAFVQPRSPGSLSPFVPSFEDLFRVILAIIHCENENFPNLPWPASRKVGLFLAACVREADAAELPMSLDRYEEAWGRLAVEFEMPERTRPRLAPVPADCAPGCDCELCREFPLARG